jgi:adenosylcobinamide kinase/adenosylcobinamide-phosphate guanylyltransferase
MSKLIFITGGQRSGKSSYGQKLAESLSKSPVYLATSNEDEVEFNSRIALHQQDRGEQWRLIEEPINLDKPDFSDDDVVLLDCVTLWLSNVFHKHEYDLDRSFTYAKKTFSNMSRPSKALIVVSNEIGMGLHAQDSVSRRFVDLQGWTNQFIAMQAQQAVLMVSGLPLFLKTEEKMTAYNSMDENKS